MADPSVDKYAMEKWKARLILGLRDEATWPEIQKRYRKLALRTHPDKEGGSAKDFQLVAEAFAALTPVEESGYAKSYFLPTPEGEETAEDAAYFGPRDEVQALSLAAFQALLAGEASLDAAFPEVPELAAERQIDVCVVDARTHAERQATGQACVEDFGDVRVRAHVCVLSFDQCLDRDGELVLSWDGDRRRPHFRRERATDNTRWWAPDLEATVAARRARYALEGVFDAAARGARVVVVSQTGARTTREVGEDALVAELVRNARVLGPGGLAPRVLAGGFYGWRTALGLATDCDPRSHLAAVRGGWTARVDAIARQRADLRSPVVGELKAGDPVSVDEASSTRARNPGERVTSLGGWDPQATFKANKGRVFSKVRVRVVWPLDGWVTLSRLRRPRAPKEPRDDDEERAEEEDVGAEAPPPPPPPPEPRASSPLRRREEPPPVPGSFAAYLAARAAEGKPAVAASLAT